MACNCLSLCLNTSRSGIFSSILRFIRNNDRRSLIFSPYFSMTSESHQDSGCIACSDLKKFYLNLFKKNTLFSVTFCVYVDCKIVWAFLRRADCSLKNVLSTSLGKLNSLIVTYSKAVFPNRNPWQQRNVFVGEYCLLLQLVARISLTRKVQPEETEKKKWSHF